MPDLFYFVAGPLENVVLQTTAVAAATMPLAGGFVGIIPALQLLTPESGGPVVLSFWQLVLWCARSATHTHTALHTHIDQQQQ